MTRRTPVLNWIRLTFILCPLVLVLAAPQQALADDWWNESTTSVVKKVNQGSSDEVNAQRFTFSQVNNTLSAIGGGILDPTGQNTSAVSEIGHGIALIIGNPPVDTQQYLAYMGSKAGFIPQAYAQGVGGFDILSPIQKLWIATRNVAYIITSLILVVIGFMIMLRKKIDAQTVIGVQQALPGLVITLLLITFSYAIAGFVIDMIYFVTYFSVKLLALNGVFSDSGSAAIATIRNSNIFNIAWISIFGNELGSSVASAASAVGNLTNDLLSVTISGTTIGASLISTPIAYVVFAGAILFAVFKLFFSLLMSYIQIIALSILGPLQLMLNALPGSDAFSKWFRSLLANAMAFPAAALMLVFAAALTTQSGNEWKISSDIGWASPNAGVKWIPPLLFGQSTAPTSNSVKSAMALFGIGILLMTPKVVDMVKEAIQAPEFKYTSAIGEATGFGYQQGRAAAAMPFGMLAAQSELAYAKANPGMARLVYPGAAEAEKSWWRRMFYTVNRGLGRPSR